MVASQTIVTKVDFLVLKAEKLLLYAYNIDNRITGQVIV